MRRARTLLLLPMLLAAGCGGATGSDRPDTEASLLLDSAPNGAHAGIYLATQRGFDSAEGVRLKLRRPGASTDGPRSLETGRTDLAILDIHDLGLARERGADLVGVMALVQGPLAAVLAQPGVGSPRELEGARVGLTGRPSDAAVLRSVVRAAGGNPRRLRETAIGSEAVEALLARRVDGATAFWSVEGVAVRRKRPGIREFRVDEFGAPRYPELVLCVTRATLEDRPDEIRAVIRALQRGYGEAQVDPESAVSAMPAGERGLDRGTLAAQLDAVAPAFSAGVPAFGLLERGRLEAWARWAVEFGILRRRPDVGRAFDTGLVGPAGR